MNKHAIPLVERFWSKVNVTDTGRCWNWSGAKDGHGYGLVLFNGKSTRAHKVALYLRSGSFPAYACHRCDNPGCCNPDHIYSGNHASNMADKVARGRCRTNGGIAHYAASLTRSDVLKIRRLSTKGGFSINQIAKAVGVKFGAVQRVLSGKSYRNI